MHVHVVHPLSYDVVELYCITIGGNCIAKTAIPKKKCHSSIVTSQAMGGVPPGPMNIPEGGRGLRPMSCAGVKSFSGTK